jgi:hypothetical protein
MPQTSGSLLLGLDGVVVESVHVDVDRTRTIHVLTAVDWVGVCPGCTARSSRSKGWVTTGPRDIKIGNPCRVQVESAGRPTGFGGRKCL